MAPQNQGLEVEKVIIVLGESNLGNDQTGLQGTESFPGGGSRLGSLQAVHMDDGADQRRFVGMDGDEQDRLFAAGEDVADDQGSHHPNRRRDVGAVET